MKEQQDGLRLIKAEITHFKNIEHKIIEFDHHKLVIVSGKNGAGKSSLIQAILSPLLSKMVPEKPIKEGEETASVSLLLSGTLHGEMKEYTIDMHFTKANQKGKLYVKNEKGEQIKKSVKTVLDGIVGNIAFDIFEFLDATKLTQVKTLKEVAGVTVEIDTIDRDRKVVFDKRTYTNSRINELDAIANNHAFSKEQISLYSTTVDLEPLNKELSEISEKINEWSRIDSGVTNRNGYIKEIDADNTKSAERIKEFEKEIFSLKNRIDANNMNKMGYQNEVHKAKQWLENNPKPDAVTVTEKIKNANEHNQKCAEIKNLTVKHRELLELKEKSSEFTVALEGYDDRKKKVFENSKLPVKGLTISEDEIYYEGLPFNETQIPKSKIIAIGAAISMALNPNLKVIVVKDGSLLDKDTINTLMKIVEKKGYMLIVEKVDDNGGELEIKFSEGV